MKLLLAFCIISLIVLCNCHPQQGSFRSAKGCTVDGIFVPAGEELTVPGKCMLVKCTGLNKALTTSCQEKDSGEKCFKKQPDISKPFPDCCPQWICN